MPCWLPWCRTTRPTSCKDCLLQATGFTLDDPGCLQPVTIPPNGRLRLEWWGTANAAASASLRFSVRQAAYRMPCSYPGVSCPSCVTSLPRLSLRGSLPEPGERLELVSLPATFDADSGSLEV
jgi:hypothetical protein